MQKPNLDMMWETFIKIGLQNETPYVKLYDVIRFKVSSVISSLKDNNAGSWYCFLVHGKNSGVSTTEDDDNLYLHIRFTIRKDIDPDKVLSSLPDYCEMTRYIKPRLNSIAGIDKSQFKSGEIEEAWRLLGEQSEWFLQLLLAYKEETNISPQQVGQFLHFFANMSQLRIG